jgi:YtkA-like protein
MTKRLALLTIAVFHASLAGERYQVTLRLPPAGLFAREEMEIEFRVEDTSRPDPLGGFAPVVRAAPDAAIEMPRMPGMPKFSEAAHVEAAPGDYGIHPTFAHGGEYRLTLRIHPPGGEPFERTFPLSVMDAKPKAAPARFSLDVAAQPKRPKAGEPVELTLVVRDRGAAVASFDTMHERSMHLVIVRKDLGQFAHEHPEPQAGGGFRLRYTFAAGGDYRLFADVAPHGAGAQIVMAKVKVAGPEGAAFDVRRQPTMEALPARKTIPLALSVPHDIEPYLGAAGHLMIVHEDGETFVHSHPAEDGAAPELQFFVRFPKPGLYRGWLQYQRAGKVETHEMVLRAEEK